MERKIGEIFEFGGEWYQCVIGYHCSDCAFNNDNCEERERITLKEKLTKEEITGLCASELRNDKTSVIFKKLEKVGEPFSEYNPSSNRVILFQRYKCYQKPVFNDNITGTWRYWFESNTIEIEIKQTKEDMEEKKVKISRGNADYLISKLQDILADHLHGGESDEVIAEFEKFIDTDEKHSNSEKIGKNLKPFDLEAAKAGKPVCTRDGRKARIICFDRNDLYPIVALIECEDGKEIIGAYSKEGQTEIYEIKGTNLMMLPEKKEGWINVYALNICYSSKEEAEANIDRDYEDEYVRTVKINWEE